MRKSIIVLAAALLWGSGPAAGQRLKPGDQVFFLKSGERITGRFADLSAAPLDFRLEDGTTIPLRDLWMINFDTAEWNFPPERNLIETNEHYVFMKNGDVSSGRITSFSTEQRAFVFESGETFPLPQCRRIYFSKTVPRGLR